MTKECAVNRVIKWVTVKRRCWNLKSGYKTGRSEQLCSVHMFCPFFSSSGWLDIVSQKERKGGEKVKLTATVRLKDLDKQCAGWRLEKRQFSCVIWCVNYVSKKGVESDKKRKKLTHEK